MSKTKKTTTTKRTKSATAASAQSDPDLVPLGEVMKKPAARKNGKTKAATEKKLSCLDAAAQVLKGSGKPMNCKAMVDAMMEKRLWTTKAPTPAATLYSAILREMQTKKNDARFKKVDRGQFALND